MHANGTTTKPAKGLATNSKKLLNELPLKVEADHLLIHLEIDRYADLDKMAAIHQWTKAVLEEAFKHDDYETSRQRVAAAYLTATDALDVAKGI